MFVMAPVVARAASGKDIGGGGLSILITLSLNSVLAFLVGLMALPDLVNPHLYDLICRRKSRFSSSINSSFSFCDSETAN